MQRAKRKQRLGNKARSALRGRWDSLSDRARVLGEVFFRPLIRVMATLGVHPNAVTILGLLLQVGVGVVFGLGYITLGGWLLLMVAPVDAVDGALARAVGRKSRFGAFLDSTLDRISDSALILGLTAHYLRQEALLMVALLLISLVAVMLISYIRARAEALGFSCKIGLLTRMERIIFIGVLSGVGLPSVMAWGLAVLSVFTVMQRILHVYAVSRQEG